MYVDPGDLNKKIQIIRKSDGETYDEGGRLVEFTETVPEYLEDTDGNVIYDTENDGIATGEYTAPGMEVVRTCWAKVSSTSGTELIKAGQELSDAKKRFLVRWTPTEINTAMIVRYQGEDHNILRVNTYSDNKEYTEIWTDEKKAVI